MTEEGARRAEGPEPPDASIVAKLFARQSEGLTGTNVLDVNAISEINRVLGRVERYWTDQIRYIY